MCIVISDVWISDLAEFRCCLMMYLLFVYFRALTCSVRSCSLVCVVLVLDHMSLIAGQ